MQHPLLSSFPAGVGGESPDCQGIPRQWLRGMTAMGLLLLLSTTAHAADLQISASLDRERIAMNEQAVLSVIVSGNSMNLPEPQLPGLADFQVYSAGRAQNMSWINGQASGNVRHSYVLTPKQPGSYTIPPVRVSAGAQTLESASLKLEVVQGNASALPPESAPASSPRTPASQAAPLVFVSASVDKTSAYVGEPVTLSFRLYSRTGFLRQPQYQPPDTSGFWTEDLPPQRNFQAQVKNTPYQVVEVKTALFPTHAGKATIGAATLRVAIQNFSSDPVDFFGNFFGGGQEKILKTELIQMQIKPLPTPAPAGFKGAVGQYRVSAELDKPSAKVGQPLTLTLTVSGEGNIKSLPEITLPPITNFRTFDANAATNIEKKDYRVRGSKVYKTVIIPAASGEFTLPPVPFVYFDPVAQTYKTLQSKSLSVRVAPGAEGASPALPAVPGGAAAPGIKVLGEDIRYIKTPSALASEGGLLYRSKFFLGVNALAFLTVLLSAVWPLYRRIFLSNPALVRFRQARARALALLKTSEKTPHRALQTYLTDKLGMTEDGISQRTALEVLRQRGASAESAGRVKELWNTLDLYQFAPAQVSPDDLEKSLQELGTVINTLEKEIQWKN